MVLNLMLLLIYYLYRFQKNLDVAQHSEFILKMYEITKLNIEKMNGKYRITGSKGKKKVKLEAGDLEWVHLRKGHFLELRKSNLMPHATSPFIVIKKILGLVPRLIF
jgi:hypothetical protein